MAYEWYKRLLDDYRFRKGVYLKRGFKKPTISPGDWEVLGSILLKDNGKPGGGSDLENYEVKSAQEGNQFEYQYQKRSGLSKWEKDVKIQHLLISYGNDYTTVQARLLSAEIAAELMAPWKKGILEAYHRADRECKQRCRTRITYDQAVQYGKIVFEIIDGKLHTGMA